MYTISFQDTESNHDAYKGRECMKNLCQPLREHAMNVINIMLYNDKCPQLYFLSLIYLFSNFSLKI